MNICSIISWVLHGRLPNCSGRESENLISMIAEKFQTVREINKFGSHMQYHRSRHKLVNLEKKKRKTEKKQVQFAHQRQRYAELQKKMQKVSQELEKMKERSEEFINSINENKKSCESYEIRQRERIEAERCPHAREREIRRQAFLLEYQLAWQKKYETETNYSDSEYQEEFP